jgi:opacity protein-like surface antigen
MQLTAGEGRLARPRFRYTASLAFGYDDNVFTAPTTPNDVPSQSVRVQTSLATPGTQVQVVDANGQVQTVTTGATPAQFTTVNVPGVAGQRRVGSFLTRANLGFDMQIATRRSLFTFDIRGGADWYWDRPGKDVDYNGSMALIYLYRLTPRLQFDANIGASYLTQPDLTQVNTPTRQSSGAYLNLTSKFDLSYRFNPRLSAVGSVSYNTLRYAETTAQAGNYGETIFGIEGRYLFSPRLTLLSELRYSMTAYETSNLLDSHTFFLLLGGEITLSRRFTGTLRLGEAIRSFDTGGNSASAPYGEATLNYQVSRATVVQWNGRYGFEEPPSPTSELTVFRTGLSLVHSFSPRLRGTASSNYVRRSTKDKAANVTTTDNTVDFSLGAEYTLTKQWTLNANYNYTTAFGSVSLSDYYRNRLFLGAEYEF